MDGPYIPRKTRYTLSNMDFSRLTGKCIDSRRLWGADRVTSHENWDTTSCALASECSLSRVTQAGMAGTQPVGEPT